MRYLTEEWLAAASDAVADIAPLDTGLVIGFRVENAPHTSQRIQYSLVLGPNQVGYESGIGRASVTMVLNWELACAINQGTQGAQRTFLDGQLGLDGEPAALLGHQARLAQLSRVEDRLAPLRSITTYD